VNLERQLHGIRDTTHRRQLLQELGSWRRKEEIFWEQRAKANFLRYGDSNTRWFHARASMRKKTNTISKLEREDGTMTDDSQEIAHIIMAYYEQLFSSSGVRDLEQVLQVVPVKVTQAMNEVLCAPYSEDEIFKALKAMHPNKAPGPDGFTALFFQQFWDVVGSDVCRVVLQVLHGGPMPDSLNHTNVVLIPKTSHPTNLAQFRPISLCHVIYKLITKVISTRLKSLLPSIISETQSAFTPGRLITDNILVSYEVFHSIYHQKSSNGSMAIKLDMSKAYDRVEWGFLRNIMLRMGFCRDWVNMVMNCVESASFSFVLNGVPTGHLVPQRGIRQGDPISPYLFLFVTEGLSALMNAAEANGRIQGHRICVGAPRISHLLFADDSIFFCKASAPQAVAVKEVLGLYERASGQTVNVQKSNVVFAKGVPTSRREEILIILDMREVLSHEKYLGLPTFVGRSRKKPFLFLKDKIRQRMSVWMDRLLSWAGREVLIKAVAQAIPTYAMSVFKLPTTFCKAIQSIITRFWWSNDPQKRKIHWVSSERLCDKKDDGGLGFREMEAFNDAMLAKQVWRLLHQETSLVHKILKARYFPNGQMLSAELGVQPSFTWRSLWGARDIIQKGS